MLQFEKLIGAAGTTRKKDGKIIRSVAQPQP